MSLSATEEIALGKRFQFGRNWKRFLSVLSDDRISEAENSLRTMLEVKDLRNKSFLDVGSGSGLFSLAARRLGAIVSSFDYDPQSIACTNELKRRYFPGDRDWHVEEGSILDTEYVARKGQFDIVYSWGVLHHTGAMWQALGNVCLPVAPQGQLFVAIYNDQGGISTFWRNVKRIYCSGSVGKALVCGTLIPAFIVRGIGRDILEMRNPLRRYLKHTPRGMSIFYDWFDWLGGFPFEVAKPEAIMRFYRDRGFTLKNLATVGGGQGNNQFVFSRSSH